VKTTKIIFSLCIVFNLFFGNILPVVAQTSQQTVTDGGPVVVRVYYSDEETSAKILVSYEVQKLETNYEEGYHVLELTKSEIENLLKTGLRVEIDSEWKSSLPDISIQTIPNYPCYRTVEETFASAAAIAMNYPNLAEWIDVGDSWEKSVGQNDGYDMMVLRLTNELIPGDKPALFVTGAIHAREYTTAELATRFAEYLVENYNVDPDVTWILDYHEVHLMLQTNPDGRKEAEVGRSWRKNTNENYCGVTSAYRGADLNRNFTYMWDCCGGSSDNPCDQTYHGAYAGSEPEIDAVMEYMRTIIPDRRGSGLTDPAPLDTSGVYIDLHSYGELIMWPWGFTSNVPPNGVGMQTLGRKWGYFNDYLPRQAIGLYPTDGASKDYAYGELGIPGYTIELGTAFFQACTTFTNTIVPDNLPVLLYAAKVARAPYMLPSGPDVVNLAISEVAVPVGESVTLTAQINDTRYNNENGTEPTQAITTAVYYIDTPPWEDGASAISLSASDGAFSSTIENVTGSINTTGWSEGRHMLYVQGRDAAGNWGPVTSIFLRVYDPLSVELLSFTANPLLDIIEVKWETVNEINNIGFNLYRSETRDGERTKLNTELIPTLVPPGALNGAIYFFLDTEIEFNSDELCYWLEDVDTYGNTDIHGPAILNWKPMPKLIIPANSIIN